MSGATFEMIEMGLPIAVIEYLLAATSPEDRDERAELSVVLNSGDTWTGVPVNLFRKGGSECLLMRVTQPANAKHSRALVYLDSAKIVAVEIADSATFDRFIRQPWLRGPAPDMSLLQLKRDVASTWTGLGPVRLSVPYESFPQDAETLLGILEFVKRLQAQLAEIEADHMGRRALEQVECVKILFDQAVTLGANRNGAVIDVTTNLDRQAFDSRFICRIVNGCL